MKKNGIAYKKFVKRYMVFTVWYCCVIWVLAGWFLRKMVRKSLKNRFFKNLKKNFVYTICFFFNLLKLRGESCGIFKKICFKEGVKD